MNRMASNIAKVRPVSSRGGGGLTQTEVNRHGKRSPPPKMRGSNS